MTDNKTTKQKPTAYKGRLISQKVGHRSFPVLLGTGTAPEKGDLVTLDVGSKVLYTGKVSDVTKTGNEFLIEFDEGLSPVKKEA